MPNIMRAKCIVAGDSGVGKSAVVQMFASDGVNYPKNYNMTCGVDIVTKSVNVPDTNDVVELYIYDSSGKEFYAEMLKKLWHHPSMLVVVADVTDENSFNSVSMWVDMVNNLKQDNSMPGVLIGNKADQKERRSVSPKLAQDIAKSNSLQYFECSTKEMKGVEEPFFYLVNEWHKVYLDKTDIFKTLT